ncbi:MAG: type II CRISPR RNA-guided endonuclease Cas9 [Raoultibacter sp.]
MNLRNLKNYSIGLDLGTGSVGWSVTDETGALARFKGKPTWGSRVFPSAETAADTRIHRGQRRRYSRRRQRLNLLQGFFAEEIHTTDPDFFIRLNQARLWAEDRADDCKGYQWPLFNGSDFTEVDYYKRFPTIYHLRSWLMEADEKVDIRLIYLAFHNIIKHRGNFLHQDNPKLSAKTANMAAATEALCSALEAWCEQNDRECTCKKSAIKALFEDDTKRRREKQEDLVPLLGLGKDDKPVATALAKAVFGYKVEFALIFFIEPEESSFYLSDDEKVEAFAARCPDEGMELFEALLATYSSYVLMGILKGADGETLSSCKVREYQRYGEDLALLKGLVKQYAPDSYTSFFRGEFYENYHEYDPKKAQGYTKYNLGTGKVSYEDFLKEIPKLFEGTEAECDARYVRMQAAMEDHVFLRRLKTGDNGVIPYQLHLEEMDAIIAKQAQYYPFLAQDRAKIESLVTFRIPYYVGPLTTTNAAKAADGSLRFAWSVRQAGQENATIFPWNWEEVIDKDASAEAFIKRMTGLCTYLQGEPVLPRCSLVYEMFCVLNELNGAKWTQDGDAFNRFDAADRLALVDELFKKRKTVSYAAIQTWLERHNRLSPKVSGAQGETGFESKLNSYIDFCQILEVEELSDADVVMAEEIIGWNTLFEDRKILKRKIQQAYGERLSDAQIKKMCNKRYVGWGKLSQKLLTGLTSNTDNGPKSIMDLLVEGDVNGTKRIGRALNLMEILHDDQLEFRQLIAEHNDAYAEGKGGLSVDDLQGSPALRRSITQALRIVKEIVDIAGNPPASIFIEVTREEDEKNKGKRTRRRYSQLSDALEAFKKEDPHIIREFKDIKPAELDERLTLYFMQRGKCMYSGASLDIRRLSGPITRSTILFPRRT